jgi:hypothetical protein
MKARSKDFPSAATVLSEGAKRLVRLYAVWGKQGRREVAGGTGEEPPGAGTPRRGRRSDRCRVRFSFEVQVRSDVLAAARWARWARRSPRLA